MNRTLVALAVVSLFASRPALAAEPLQVRATRGLRGVVPVGGADFVQLHIHNRSGIVQRGSARIDDGGSATFTVPAGGRISVLLVRPLPLRVSSLGPVTAQVIVDRDSPLTVPVPGAEVIADLSLVVDSDAAFVAESARRLGNLGGRAVLLSPVQLPRTWLSLRGVHTLFIRAGTASALSSRALALGVQVCRLNEQSFTCTTGVPRQSLRRYPAQPTVRTAMNELREIALVCGLWLLLLVIIWRRNRHYLLGLVGIALPIVALMAVPAERLAPATIVASGHHYRTQGDAEAFVVARVRGRRGLAKQLPKVGVGELWLRPDSSDAHRGELRQFHPARPVRFADQRIWRVEGFVSVVGVGPSWRDVLTPVVLAAEAQ